MTDIRNPITEAAKTALKLVRAIRAVDDQLQAQTMEALFLVAANPDIEHRTIQDLLGLSQSSVSRNLSLLSEHKGKGEAGLGLIETYTDTMRRTHKRARLTDKGRIFMAGIQKTLEETYGPASRK